MDSQNYNPSLVSCFSPDREKMIGDLLALRSRCRDFLNDYGSTLGPIALREYKKIMEDCTYRLNSLGYGSK